MPLDGNSQAGLKQKLTELKDPESMASFLDKLVKDAYNSREKQVGQDLTKEIEKFVFLQSIDRLWIDHLDAMENLREGIGLRGYGQQDPLVEYKKEAFAGFESLMGMIDNEIVKRIFRVQVAQRPSVIPQNMQTNVDQQDHMGLKPSGVASQTATTTTGTSVSTPSSERPGRNDPCPCGSNKKYKKCCYPKYG